MATEFRCKGTGGEISSLPDRKGKGTFKKAPPSVKVLENLGC
jgi:hypothetical protein